MSLCYKNNALYKDSGTQPTGCDIKRTSSDAKRQNGRIATDNVNNDEGPGESLDVNCMCLYGTKTTIDNGKGSTTGDD